MLALAAVLEELASRCRAGAGPRWHAELAWLPGLGVVPDVLIEAAGDRFTAVTPRTPRAAAPGRDPARPA